MNCPKTLRRDLKYSSLDGFLFSICVGAGETFLPAYALAAGFGEVTAGYIAAIPFLAGATLQLAAPKLIGKFKSYRTWIVLLASLQGFSFLPLIAFASAGARFPEWLLFAVVTVYWFSGMAAGPAWNTWMVSLVPSGLRPKYFARRSRFAQFGLLIGLMTGGFLLHFAKSMNHELTAFAVLFMFSAFCRLASAFCLSRQSVSRAVCKQNHISVKALVERFRSGSDGRLVGFLLIFGVAVNLGSPFFNPFLLKQLGLSYVAFMFLIGASFVTKIAVFHWLGEASRRSTPYGLMRLGVIGTICLPVLWTVSRDFWFMLFVHVMTGAVWAFYELGLTLALFHAIRDEERTSFLSYYNFASALAVLAGTSIGGLILSRFGEAPRVYYAVFVLSALARFGAFFVLERAIVRIGATVQVHLPSPLRETVVYLKNRRSGAGDFPRIGSAS